MEHAALQALADESAIRDLARRYAHCVWQRDAPGAAALFAPDAVMDTGDRPLEHHPLDVFCNLIAGSSSWLTKF